jgi:single-stranded-DNA-specific exonuclease
MKFHSIRRYTGPIAPALQELHPILQRVYAARQIQSVEELNYDINRLLHFKTLTGIKEAAELLAHAIIQQKKILIVGDFDTDGATSTALACEALKTFGAQQVTYLVPNRFEYGYGLTPEIISIAQCPDLIMTVDNGISSYEGVVAAQDAGIQVLITDHHLAPELLPPAEVIVNPQQPGDRFESKHLAGVGVTFYVMLALRDYLKQHQWFQQQSLPYPKMYPLLDLVALGTVADMVKLDLNNRILVHHGLQQLKSSKGRPGIYALAQVAGCSFTDCLASDLSFTIAPRLNAAGRLKDMSLGIECLLAPDLQTALPLAQQLDTLNKERRSIENTMQKKAFSTLEKLNVSSHQASICLFDPNWHQGIIGLVAGRIKERWHKPTIVFAPSGTPGELKGSARSTPGIHIRDILAAIAVKNPQLLSRFGGHAAAAGLSLALNHYSQFATLFEEMTQQHLSMLKLDGTLQTDGELTPAWLNFEIGMLLRKGGPWGQGFTEPLFDGYFQIISQRIVGQRHLQLTLRLEGLTRPIKAILFHADLNEWPNPRIRSVQATYHLTIHEWEGRRDIQLLIQTLTQVNK